MLSLRNAKNQRMGASFERMFEWAARRDNYLVIRNGQNVKWVGEGRMVAIKSNLDWTLINCDGKVAFVDTKTFQGDHFTYSAIDARQMQLGLDYQKRGVAAGFVVHLRKSNIVLYVPAHRIIAGGPRSRYGVGEGRKLGQLASFTLAPIFAS